MQSNQSMLGKMLVQCHQFPDVDHMIRLASAAVDAQK